MKKLFLVVDKYKLNADFIRRVINHSLQNIFKQLGKCYNYNIIKTSRSRAFEEILFLDEKTDIN
jgi:hypothetical protein